MGLGSETKQKKDANKVWVRGWRIWPAVVMATWLQLDRLLTVARPDAKNLEVALNQSLNIQNN